MDEEIIPSCSNSALVRHSGKSTRVLRLEKAVKIEYVGQTDNLVTFNIAIRLMI